MTQAPDPASSFPPQSIAAFLRCCAGEWMSLRSRFDLEQAVLIRPADDPHSEGEAGDGDAWHSSERGELVVLYLEPEGGQAPGGLEVGPRGEPAQRLLFADDGSFESGGRRGRWQLWPDGSLELVLVVGARELRERIWFTKPNLRLRSTLESSSDGRPGRASFSSEIRRVSRPAAAGS
ncbi:MAG: phycobiliprotein lyase [Cyanobacteria bacterium J06638_7]